MVPSKSIYRHVYAYFTAINVQHLLQKASKRTETNADTLIRMSGLGTW